ncbi:HNH endonuclease signature motif containing protein [Pseudomonas sp. P9_31]|uniref:HNH endonuclease n=1 Tax=Pseudomonas sp. P9_31 TaxID=3043448 RepID=UPI002A35FC81|nr:HNH endonuclease signature motif containing protein [Pseudomonas sp. P9_31]WPN59408.1 HNH endonuclease signature motif containing protein [Pseudomonas sp. P9_31]
MGTPKERTGWDDQELEASVDAYLKMLSLELSNQPIKKADENRLLREGPLSKRSASSVEYRMQNISAVMAQMGLRHIVGYVPAKNVGTGISSRVRKILAEKNIDRFRLTPEPANQQVTYRLLEAAPPHADDVPEGILNPIHISTATIRYARAKKISDWILKQSEGRCEGCKQKAPFLRSDGLPYLEVHHVKHLAKKGSDRPKNAVALCPNCHRRCHYSSDRDEFTAWLYDNVARLRRE